MQDRCSTTEPARDGFVAGIRAALLPWMVWAAHFGFSYVWHAVTCMSGMDGNELLGLPLPTTGLLLASIVAIMWLAWMLLRSARLIWPRDGLRDAATHMRFGSALLALLAVLWETLPMLLLPACAS